MKENDCREWLRQYAADNYGAVEGLAVDIFVECCAQAIERGNTFDILGQYAAATGQKECELWFALRAMMQGMRVAEEVRDAVQLWFDLEDLPEEDDDWGWDDED